MFHRNSDGALQKDISGGGRILPALVASATPLQTPLFPTLYSESERKLNDNLTKPRKYMQKLLEIAGRPKATLHSFHHTFNNTLRDLGLGIEDRQILLAHSSSQMTKVYTHPNFELAWEYVNRMPNPQVGNTLIQR